MITQSPLGLGFGEEFCPLVRKNKNRLLLVLLEENLLSLLHLQRQFLQIFRCLPLQPAPNKGTYYNQTTPEGTNAARYAVVHYLAGPAAWGGSSGCQGAAVGYGGG